MRVLFVTQEFPPETGWGGVGTYTEVLGEALAADGVDVHVLSTVPGQPASVRTRAGVTVHRFPQPRLRGVGRLTRCPETARRLWTAATVARLMPRLPAPDSVECPEWQAEGLFLGLRRTAPLVVRLHSAARQLFPYTGQGSGLGGVDGRLAARAEEASAGRADVITGTRSNLAEMLPVLGASAPAAHTIPIPIRVPPPRELADDQPPRVTFVGRLEPRKGPEVLLRAAPAVVAAVPEVRFVFVGRDGARSGSSSTTEWLRREAERLGVGAHVEFTGGLPTEGVTDELAKATVCAFPSSWESFGNAVAEAAAVGRPVVTSAIPPFEDLVDHGVTGWRVPVSDTEAWAGTLIEALSDPARARRMGQAGSELVRRISEPGAVARLTLAAHAEARERWRGR